MALAVYACLDGSGKVPDSSYLSLCGYTAPVQVLSQFKRSWVGALLKHEIPAGFHTVEAMNWRGSFAAKANEWGDRRLEKRQEVLLDLAAAIKSHPMMAVGICLDIRLLPPKHREAKRPELLMVERVLDAVVGQLEPDDTVSLLIDDEEDFAPLCFRLLRKLRLSRPDLRERIDSICFGDDKAYAELQAADLLAYFACKELERKDKTPDAPQDPVHAALNADVEGSSGRVRPVEAFTADAVSRMLEAHSA